MPFIIQGKTNFKYILIIVILATIVGGGILGYYYLWIKDLERKIAEIEIRIPQKVKDETTNWQIYENKEYGYSFRYPSNWFIETDSGTNEVEQYAVISKNKDGETDKVAFHVNPLAFGACEGALNTKSEGLLISGYSGTKVTCDSSILFIFENVKGNYFAVIAGFKEESTIVNQILSTFKFIE